MNLFILLLPVLWLTQRAFVFVRFGCAVLNSDELKLKPSSCGCIVFHCEGTGSCIVLCQRSGLHRDNSARLENGSVRVHVHVWCAALWNLAASISLHGVFSLRALTFWASLCMWTVPPSFQSFTLVPPSCKGLAVKVNRATGTCETRAY